MSWKWVELKEDVKDCDLKKGDICEVFKEVFLADSVHLNQFMTFAVLFNKRTDNFCRVSVDSLRPYHGQRKSREETKERPAS